MSKEENLSSEYNWGPFDTPPNILIIMSDQQRTTQNFPEHWAKKNLPALQWLTDNGLSFPNHFCSSAPCGPSRGIIYSGKYQTKTGVWNNNGTLPAGSSLGNMMDSLGYDVTYKGKWDLTQSFSKQAETRPNLSEKIQHENDTMKNDYCFSGYTSPDMGDALSFDTVTVPPDCDIDDSYIYTMGGSTSPYKNRLPNDNTIVNGPLENNEQCAVEYINSRKGKEQPFFMVVSMVNPHDVFSYPNNFEAAGYQEKNWTGNKFKGFELPPSHHELLKNKPMVQQGYLNGVKQLVTFDEPKKYIQFYAYLQTLTDSLSQDLIDALKHNKLLDNTIIVRISDHGELGLSHGGMVQKTYNMYQEAVNVPLIFSNPKLQEYYKKENTEQKGKSKHKPFTHNGVVTLADLAPTLARIGGAKHHDIHAAGFQGVDISATVADPNLKTQDNILFTFWGGTHYPNTTINDQKLKITLRQNDVSLENLELFSTINECNNICAVFDGVWKYAIYFTFDHNGASTPVYEMYNVKNDPHERNNLLYNPSKKSLKKAESLFKNLCDQLTEKGFEIEGWSEFHSYDAWEATFQK